MNPPRPELDDQMIEWLLAYDEALETGDIREHRPSLLNAEQRERLSRILVCVRQLHDLRQAETATPRDAPPPVDAPPGSGPLARLGRFDVRRLLGGGGFGLVYLAYDRMLRREVAVKVPQPDALMTPEARERFLREGQIAAALDHPNLVRILEVGAEGSLVYLVSEFCSGPTLEAWLKDRSEPVAPLEAAQLLAQLADGVASMHRHDVLHRDLKPANILLQRQEWPQETQKDTRKERPGEGGPSPDMSSFASDSVFAPVRVSCGQFSPRITDFGLAKDVRRTTQLTQEGALLGTPRYMAPEQALAGADPDTAVGPATDIYALGTILYELLAGRPPFIGGSDLDTLRQIIQDDPIPLRRLRGDTPADLETICLKCLEKEPAKRYASAAALAEELRRFQAGEPIQARPIGRLERAWRWCKRNRAAAAFLIVLLAGTTVSSVLAVVANEQAGKARRKAADEEIARSRAEEARDAARHVVELMASEGHFQVLERLPKLTPEQVKLLKTLLAYYQGYVQEEATEETERVRQGDAYSQIAKVQARLGYGELALAASRRAQEVRVKLATDFPAVPKYRYDLVMNSNNLGALLMEHGKRDEAEPLWRQALDLAAQLVTDFPAVPQYREELAGNHNNLGYLFVRSGNRTAAEREFRRALEGQAKLAAEFPTISRYRQRLASTRGNLATLLNELGQQGEAEAEYRRVLEVMKELAEVDYPEAPHHRAALAHVYTNLARMLERLEQWTKAEVEYRHATELLEKLVANFPMAPAYAIDLASSYAELARILRRQEGKPNAKTLPWFDKAILILNPITAQQPRLLTARDALSRAHAGRASVLVECGRHSESITDWQRALELDDKKRPYIRLGHAYALAHTGQPTQAVLVAEELANDKRSTGDTLRFCVRIFAGASNEVKADTALQDRYAARAVELLRQLAANEDIEPEFLESYDDLNHLRSRADFQRLLDELRAKPPKKP